ncbi:hypothetical protein P8605_32970 [Streptomyces sp. T-3]|nr:hypothetical protein [Streptomyces sp. T-3]
MPRTRCVGIDCRKNGTRRPGLAATGLRLCPDCLRELARRLEELPLLYEELEHVLAGRRGEGMRERTTGGPLPGLPFNDAAADLRAAIVTTLSSWCGLVCDEQGLPAPQRLAGPLARFLARHSLWLAGHSCAGEATDEVARLVRTARRATLGQPLRRVRLGPCVHDGCTGRLVATFRSHDPGSCTSIHCDCEPRHIWPGDQWTALRRAMDGGRSEAERWLTAGDVARLWSTTTGTVYRLASEQQWRRRSREGRTYYAETDVHECFARRRAVQSGEPADAESRR